MLLAACRNYEKQPMLVDWKLNAKRQKRSEQVNSKLNESDDKSWNVVRSCERNSIGKRQNGMLRWHRV
jgi:hypothetical protein